MKASKLLERYAKGQRKFPGINLVGKSFEGQNLSNVDFSIADLRGANFSAANLTEAILSNADIEGTNFTNTDLTKAKLIGVQTGLSKIGKIFSLILSLILVILSVIYLFIVATFTIHYFSAETIKEDTLEPGVYFLSIFLCCLYYLIASKNLVAMSLMTSVLVMLIIFAVGKSEVIRAAVVGYIVLLVPLIATVATIIVARMVGVIWAVFLALTALILVLLIGLRAVGILAKTSIIAKTSFSFIVITIGIMIIAIIFLTIYIYMRWRSDTSELPLILQIKTFIANLLGNNYPGQTLTSNKQLKFRGLEFIFARQITNLIATFFGTNFRNARLTDADFSSANLEHTNLLTDKLTRTRFHKAKNIHLARVGKNILNDPIIRDLVVNETKNNKSFVGLNLQGVNLAGFDLIGADFTNANLNEANLKGAYLTNANLKLTRVFGTDFTQAEMTGACLEKLQYDSTTIFKEVVCKFIFLQDGNRNRNPSDPDRNFNPGDFEKHFQQTANILPILLHHPFAKINK